MAIHPNQWYVATGQASGLSVDQNELVRNFPNSLAFISLRNRLLVAMCLFSDRSQMTSKGGKNKKVAHKPVGKCHILMCSVLLLNRCNMESICFIQYRSEKVNPFLPKGFPIDE